MLVCKFCQKECKNDNSLRNHERLCSKNPSRQFTWLEKNRHKFVPSNQFTKEGSTWSFNEDQLNKIREKALGRKHTTETKEKLSKIAYERGLGGHTSKKQMHYTKTNGEVVYLQSSYEIEFATILDELNIPWERPDPLIWIDENGKSHRYYPDFKIGEKYFDTKNDYLAQKDKPKIFAVSKQNNVIIIVTKEQINKKYIAEFA